MSKMFTDASFEKEVIEESKKRPVLVDFFAVWCGPCKMLGPIIDEVAELVGDKAVVGKMNTEENEETSSKFGIMSIPNVLIFRNGEVVENLMGLQSKEELIAKIEKNI